MILKKKRESEIVQSVCKHLFQKFMNIVLTQLKKKIKIQKSESASNRQTTILKTLHTSSLPRPLIFVARPLM